MVLMDPAANFTRNADRNIKLTKVKSISFHTCTSNSFAFRSAGQLIHPRATPASRRPLADLNVTSATTLTKKKDTYKHNQPRTPLQIKSKSNQIKSKIETFFTRLLYLFTHCFSAFAFVLCWYFLKIV